MQHVRQDVGGGIHSTLVTTQHYVQSGPAYLHELPEAASLQRLPTASAYYSKNDMYSDQAPIGHSAPGHLNKYKRERMEEVQYLSGSHGN